MKKYNVEIGHTIKLESYTMRIIANSKQEAINKYNEVGFNAGVRLSSGWKPTGKKLKLKDLQEIKEEYTYVCMSCGKSVNAINKDYECERCS